MLTRPCAYCGIEIKRKQFHSSLERTYCSISHAAKAQATRRVLIACPYSVERLYEMYWTENTSTNRIADNASLMLNRKINPVVVQRWLKEARVSTRSHSEANRVYSRLNPDKVHATTKKANAASLLSPKRAAALYPINPGVMSKTSFKKKELYNKEKHLKALETRKCAYCGKEVTRLRSRFQKPVERTFCGLSCSAKARFCGKILDLSKQNIELTEPFPCIIPEKTL